MIKTLKLMILPKNKGHPLGVIEFWLVIKKILNLNKNFIEEMNV